MNVCQERVDCVSCESVRTDSKRLLGLSGQEFCFSLVPTHLAFQLKIRRLSLLYLFSFCEQKADSCRKVIHPVLFNFGDEQDIYFSFRHI